MSNELGLVLVEVGVLRKIIQEAVRQELEHIKIPTEGKENTYKGTDMLSISQVAEYFGVSRKTIDNYRKGGKIPEPKFNLSGKPRWAFAELTQAINNQKLNKRFLDS